MLYNLEPYPTSSMTLDKSIAISTTLLYDILMHELSRSSEKPRRFTPSQLQALIDENLAGTPMGEMLTIAELSVDHEGYIEAQVCDNLTTMFRVAERMTPEDEMKQRFSKMQAALSGATHED